MVAERRSGPAGITVTRAAAVAFVPACRNCAVYKALEEIGSARERMLRQQAQTEPGLDEAVAMGRRRAAWKDFGEAQRHAERHPRAVLDEQPRHQLLREDILTWLLRLDYGSRAAAR